MKILAANTGIIEAALYIPLAIVCMFPVADLFKKLKKSSPGLLLVNLWSVFLLALCTIYLLSSTYNPFIYFRF